MTDTPGPKIQIDDDWKAQAQAEKERLTQKTAGTSNPAGAGSSAKSSGSTGGAAAGSPAAPSMPQASMATLVSTLAAQALYAMGVLADPRTGQRMQSLDLARHHIDMLGVLEEKTKGNLTPDEDTMLASTVYELRTRYIQAAQAARMK